MTSPVDRLTKLDASCREDMIREVVSHGFTESQAQIIVDNHLRKQAGSPSCAQRRPVMATIKLVNVDEHDLSYAANLAVHFARQYPNRMGIRNGVGFTKDCLDYAIYIYRTKTQIIVRGRTVLQERGKATTP